MENIVYLKGKELIASHFKKFKDTKFSIFRFTLQKT